MINWSLVSWSPIVGRVFRFVTVICLLPMSKVCIAQPIPHATDKLLPVHRQLCSAGEQSNAWVIFVRCAVRCSVRFIKTHNDSLTPVLFLFDSTGCVYRSDVCVRIKSLRSSVGLTYVGAVASQFRFVSTSL